MNRYKKIPVLVCVLLTALNITACGQVKENGADNKEKSSINQPESDMQTIESTGSEIKEKETANAEKSSASQQENNVQTVESIYPETEKNNTIDVEESNEQPDENPDSEMPPEELLDLFINGSISAVSSADSASSFYITDLNMDSGEWDSYSVGEKVDLDNDGENELILYGPYGGIYLDARDNKVYEFAVGEGTGYVLSYTVYNGATWVMYSSRMHAEYELYHMEKFEGADNLVAEMDFSREPVDGNNIESGMKYILNGTEISYDEFEELAGRICAAEVTTN